MPGIPSGAADVRQANIVDTDSVPGNTMFSSQHATPAGAAAVLTSQTAPPEIAYAVYQHTARPQTPSKITFNVLYLDPTPNQTLATEGYYVGYADYAAGHWVLSGPYRQLQCRLTVPSSANVVSPGGFIYSVAITESGTSSRVVSVEVGYDIGRGYEATLLGPPPGVLCGRRTDIQLDPAGVPQIAYLRGPGVTQASRDQVFVARKSGSTWLRQLVTTSYPVTEVRLALGSNGLRALVLFDDHSGNIHWLIDPPDASFDFTTDEVLAIGAAHCLPDVICVNGADNPAGDLDTVLAVFCVPNGPPNVDTKFARWTGGPTITGNVVGAPTREPGRLVLARRSDNTAIVSVPKAPLFPQWDVDVGSFSALTDTWGFGAYPTWTDLDVSESDYHPEAVVRQLPGGSLVGAYSVYSNNAVVVAQSSTGWAFDPADRVPGAQFSTLDCEVFPDGRLGIVGVYGNYSLVLHTGQPGTGGAWNSRNVTSEPYTGMQATLAIDAAGSCHIAAPNMFNGTLMYYKLDGATQTSQVVDTGAMTFGVSMIHAPIVMANNQLHVFYTDLTHLRLLHAVNENGTWLKEGEVLATEGFPYFAFAAGYLENEDRLWVGYMGAVGRKCYVASGKPDGTDWTASQFVGDAEEYCVMTDDETNVGALSYTYAVNGGALGFTVGDPRTGPHPTEIVAPTTELSRDPWALAYDAGAGTWGAVSNDVSHDECYYFYRQAPGVWTGPHLVTSSIGPTAYAIGSSLNYLPDGTARVVVMEREEATPNTLKANVYSSATGPPAFALLSTVMAYDLTVDKPDFVCAVPGPTGDPVIAVVYQKVATLDWRVAVYGPQSGGTWPLQFDWLSGVLEAPEGYGCSMAATPAGEAALSIVDSDTTSPIFGRVLVYYPW